MESNQAISTTEIKQQMQVLQAEKQSVRNEINNVTMKIMAPVVDTRSALSGLFLTAVIKSIDTKSSLREELKFSKAKSDFLMRRSKVAGKSLIAHEAKKEYLGMSGCTVSAVVAEGKRVLLALREIEKGKS